MISGYGKYTVTSSRSGHSQPSLRGGSFSTQASMGRVNSRYQVEATTIGLAGQNAISGLTGFGKNYQTGYIEDITGSISQHTLRNMYRDIYYHDSVGGSVVDLLSNIPFDDFSLHGISDPKVLEIYVKSLENMKIQTLMPSLTVDYLVLGCFIGTLSWNDNSNYFDQIIPHNPDHCEIIPVPIHGQDPIINLVPSKEIKELLNNKDPRVQRVLERLPQPLLEGFKKGKAALEPNTTVYISRNNFSTRQKGLSLYRRLLPMYFLEKTLLRGTIESVSTRLRSILHIKCGDENWEPTAENLNDISNLFKQADADPVGAVLATRQAIETNDVRSGNDFLGYSDMADMIASWKMKALGVNEAFITGEANYNTMEASLSVFMEQIRSYRARVTRELFYEKIFPGIAVANGFKKPRNSVYGSADFSNRVVTDKVTGNMHCTIYANSPNSDQVEDITQYQIPSVVWHKQLRPEADDHYMDMLQRATEAGIPVPLRMLATAAGLNLDKILDGKQEDIDVRKKVAEYVSDINSESGTDENFVGSSLGFGVKKQALSQRFQDQDQFNYKRNKSGNRVPLSSREQRIRDEKANREMASYLSNLPVETNPFG